MATTLSRVVARAIGRQSAFIAPGVGVMTIIIQLTLPDGLINFHLPWFAMALALLAQGGGAWSADRLLGRWISHPLPLKERLPS
mgnify:CR=1 FL=1